MVTNLMNIFNQVLSPGVVNTRAVPVRTSSNPFANPFMGTERSTNEFYGKNNPVQGGYFAGYYNNQPNIVGQKLFIEV